MAKSKHIESIDKNWYKDRYQSVLVHRRILWVFTTVSLVCAIIALVVVLALIPQKTIEPYVIQVDKRTGITQYVNPVTATELTANEAVKNYFIVNYIRAREGYSATDVFRKYDMVRMMSQPSPVYDGFLQEADPNNPESNVARLGSAGKKQVIIKSISYLEPQVVQVRIVSEERNDGISVSTRRHKIIIIKFKFANIPLSAEERYVNPLGFLVIDYRMDEDVA